MAALSDYPRLQYFMQSYWNQMGDEVHGTFGQAVADFSAAESETYRQGLWEDLAAADDAGIIPEDTDWDDASLAAFWEDRMLTKADLVEAQSVLAKANSRQ